MQSTRRPVPKVVLWIAPTHVTPHVHKSKHAQINKCRKIGIGQWKYNDYILISETWIGRPALDTCLNVLTYFFLHLLWVLNLTLGLRYLIWTAQYTLLWTESKRNGGVKIYWHFIGEVYPTETYKQCQLSQRTPTLLFFSMVQNLKEIYDHA